MVCGVGVVQFHLYLDIYCVHSVFDSMLEQATFLPLKLEFENMVMSMLIGNPGEMWLQRIIFYGGENGKRTNKPHYSYGEFI